MARTCILWIGLCSVLAYGQQWKEHTLGGPTYIQPYHQYPVKINHSPSTVYGHGRTPHITGHPWTPSMTKHEYRRPLKEHGLRPSQKHGHSPPQKQELRPPQYHGLRPPQVHRHRPSNNPIQITDQDINAAFNLATRNLQISPEADDTNNALAEIINEAIKILAKRKGFALNKKNTNLLPEEDVSRTSISTYCPPNKYKKRCVESPYREKDGSCNNLDNSDWGKADTTFVRFIGATYGDGVGTPRLSSTGKQLPSPRLVSTRVHSNNFDGVMPDGRSNNLKVVFGQFLAHDLTFTQEPHQRLDCCSGSERRNPECFPIEIPNDDEYFSRYGQTCMNFIRTPASLRTGCKLGPREQSNAITSVIDANTVYSNEINDNRRLRSLVGGKMRTFPAFRDLGLKDLLPLNTENPDLICRRPRDDLFCFLAGEDRANEQVLLAVVHLLFVREHNRLTDELSKINPHWNDETLYQEARRIVAAINQHITITEFLPLTLGTNGLKKYGLDTKSSGYFHGYNKEVNPGMTSGFISAAGRIGHSQLPSNIERRNKEGHVIGRQELSTVLLQPFDLLQGGRVDEYIRGMLNQSSELTDNQVTKEVTNRLFESPGMMPGLDLAALNIQRGRDHGLPSYNSWRKWCGLKPINNWRDLDGIARKTAAEEYPKLYESPEDIDLWSGGLSEIHERGVSVGPTFACIIGRQFYNLRVGDRFWYENPGWPSSFTMKQLQEIRKTSLARVICDNSDDIERIQLNAMQLPSQENPILSCRSDEIPKLNILAWKDLSYKI